MTDSSDDAARAAFHPYFVALIGNEGGLTLNAADPGNWTGGAVGKGVLNGTRYGIAAASYPEEDIRNLTPERAEALYFRDFWCRTGCDALPPLMRDLVFDSAVNNGPGNAARFLQRALGVADDGRIGPVTRAALALADPVTLGEAFQRERVTFHTKLSTWATFGKGWAIRLATVPFQAMRLAASGTG
ncbi:glycoside hydrolase family 108 protein [Roseomonas elaeocarpi]|uniref:Glycoside hydrolase family 108 protein n=1 Tax=Roseomonas elaeocarpi TaxID=907779 RepID=A0ABV6JSU4_9PROT